MSIFSESDKDRAMTLRQCATDYFKLILKNRELSNVNEMLEIDNIKQRRRIEELENKISEYEKYVIL